MLQKAIENWLINTIERRYQLPFVQVLIAEGHTIKYVSKHGQLEQGKDIISIDMAGTIWAYQLKTGNVDLKEWRKIKGEICALAELSPVHSSIPAGASFRAVLVANGRITDPVRQEIVQINQENQIKNRQVAHIETVELEELVGRFLKAQGDFTPTQPIDVEKFLKFYLASGRESFDKGLFQEFVLGSCLPESAKGGTEARHAITSAVIMTAYLLKNYQENQNHYAIFEAWISLLGYICRFANKRNMPKEIVDDIGGLILDEALNEIQMLEKETLVRPIDQAFLEGDLFGDGAYLYRVRLTMVLGTLCAYYLYKLVHGEILESKDKTLEMINANIDKCLFWGESAFPFIYWIVRFLEYNGNSQGALKLVIGLLDGITLTSKDNNTWFPSPYVTAEEAIRKVYGMIPPLEMREVEPKSMGSYVIKTLVEMLTRRGYRQLLEPRWKLISNIFLLEFIPPELFDCFLWRNETGTNDARPPEKTQSWKLLQEQAMDNKAVPSFLYDCTENMLPFFTLVSPHRATVNIIKKFEV